jgi:hypothetical protein
LARQHCLIRCRHCRIFFLTHRRNHRGLHLVSCPFGCRKEHDRRESIRRTATYYREHPEKKRALNQRRYRVAPLSVANRPATTAQLQSPPVDSPQVTANNSPCSESPTASADHDPEPQCPPALAEVLPKAQDPEVMGHVRVIVSLLEARPVSLEEIWQTLLHFWRQRTIGRRRPIDHTVAWLNTHPP